MASIVPPALCVAAAAAAWAAGYATVAAVPCFLAVLLTLRAFRSAAPSAPSDIPTFDIFRHLWRHGLANLWSSISVHVAGPLGPIFSTGAPGQGRIVFVASQRLVHEVCNEANFVKLPPETGRQLLGDALFTGFTGEASYELAHRILTPSLGPGPLLPLFPRMVEVAHEMVAHLEHLAAQGDGVAEVQAETVIRHAGIDITASVSCGERLGCSLLGTPHAFLRTLTALTSIPTGWDLARLMVALLTNPKGVRQQEKDELWRFVDRVIAKRRSELLHSGARADTSDPLGRMLTAVDPVSGKGMSDEAVRQNLLTFLIVGETTVGLMTFALHELLSNPALLARARSEADAAFGDEQPTATTYTAERVQAKLPFLELVLMEALRLHPPAAGFLLRPLADITIGQSAGKPGYKLLASDRIVVFNYQLHRDPEVWGPDANVFRPDRWENFAQPLPPDSLKAFGNVSEAKLLLSVLLHRFDMAADPAKYHLSVPPSPVTVAAGMHVRFTPRRASSVGACYSASAQTHAAAPLAGAAPAHVVSAPPEAPATPCTPAPGLPPMLLLYGSNSGSCEEFACSLAAHARSRGFAAEVAALDAYAANGAQQLRDVAGAGALLVCVTSSYEGEPPHNARAMLAAAPLLPAGSLAGLRFAVFGCGNRLWVQSYQRIPRVLDACLELAGGERLLPRGEADAAGDFSGAQEAWEKKLWATLGKLLGKGGNPNALAEFGSLHAGSAHPFIEVIPPNVHRLAQLGLNSELVCGMVTGNLELCRVQPPATAASELPPPVGSKRHVTVAIPEGVSYRAGDHFVVLPRNPVSTVQRAMRILGFDEDTQVVLRRPPGTAPFTSLRSWLPLDVPMSAHTLLHDFVELSQPITSSQLQAMIRFLSHHKGAGASAATAEFESLLANYEEAVLKPRISVLDLFMLHSSVLEPAHFVAFLLLYLPPLKPRYYSIASSPRGPEGPGHVALAVAVVDVQLVEGRRHLGTCSNFLAEVPAGTELLVAVRASKAGFHLPADPQVPVVMIGAGTGVAPFRGFIQERAASAAALDAFATPEPSRGEARLYFGCRSDADFLYREELEAWQAAGVVTLRVAQSRAPGSGRPKYVQDALWEDRAAVAAAYAAGAHFYVCGDGHGMAPAVRETLCRIFEGAGLLPWASGGAEGAAALPGGVWSRLVAREGHRFNEDLFG